MLRRWSGHEIFLVVLFVLSLPLCNPWVRGDGVGYYAYARSLLIDHNLDFHKDYIAANANFVAARVDLRGRIKREEYTATGHVENHFSVGPAILWAPFLVVAHGAVLAARATGAQVSADGYSFPYRVAMALGTAVYGFLALWISFQLAKQYCCERWAMLGTLGIWWGSSLPVYMYFNPSWSHAHSAFAVAAFLWYWHRTLEKRSGRQRIVLGLLAGLMINVYYINALLLAAPGLEGLREYGRALSGRERFAREGKWPWPSILRLLGRQAIFGLVTLAALTPTFLAKKAVYGNALESGYIPLRDWMWKTPAFVEVLFSANHGLLSWTPLLVLSIAGVVLLSLREKTVGQGLLAVTLAFYLLICAYPNWDGIASYGNRFFISLTPVFVVGLAVLLDQTDRWFARERVRMAAVALVGFFVVWNLGFIFQWGTHLVPARGPISWREMARNQVTIVPARLGGGIRAYLFGRRAMMQRIEEQDAQQIRSQSPKAVN